MAVTLAPRDVHADRWYASDADRAIRPPRRPGHRATDVLAAR